MVKFYRGSKNNYDAVTHNDAIYFAQDTGEIIMNNKVYGASQDVISQINELEAIINGDAATEGTINNRIAAEINKILDGAPDAFDTLKEIADWIATDTTSSATIVSDIANLKENSTTRFNGFVDNVAVASGEAATVDKVVFDKTHQRFLGVGNAYSTPTYYMFWKTSTGNTAYSNFYDSSNVMLTNKLYIAPDGQTYSFGENSNVLTLVVDTTNLDTRLSNVESLLNWYEASSPVSTQLTVTGILASYSNMTGDQTGVGSGVLIGTSNPEDFQAVEVWKRTAYTTGEQSADWQYVCQYSTYNNAAISTLSFPTSINIPSSAA